MLEGKLRCEGKLVIITQKGITLWVKNLKGFLD